MIKFIYGHTDETLSKGLLQVLERMMPAYTKEKLGRFRRWEDYQLHLMGRLLLRQGLLELGYAGKVLERLQYTSYGKPFIEDPFLHFTISHSGSLVTCALSHHCQLGVDVERIEACTFEDYRYIFSSDEWTEIRASPNGLQQFYQYWTKKEAVIKGNGKGWSITPTDVRLRSNFASLENTNWFLHPIQQWDGYAACLAVDRPLRPDAIEMERIEWNDLLAAAV